MDTEKLTNDEVKKWMAERDKNLKCHHFTKQVKIEHGDDSLLFFPLASIKEDKIRIYVWTEHTGYFYFHKADLREIKIKTTSESTGADGIITTIKEKTVINNFFSV